MAPSPPYIDNKMSSSTNANQERIRGQHSLRATVMTGADRLVSDSQSQRKVIFVDEGNDATCRSIILSQWGRLIRQANDCTAQKEREESAVYGPNIGPVQIE